MRTFVVLEPRSAYAVDANENMQLLGAEVLAESAMQAASTYIEQRPRKWGRYVDLWVIDRLEQPRSGPATFQVRYTGNGPVSFW